MCFPNNNAPLIRLNNFLDALQLSPSNRDLNIKLTKQEYAQFNMS